MGSRLGKKCGGNSDYFHRFLLCFLQAVGLAQFFAKYSSEHINDIAVRPALGHQGNKLTVDGLWFNNEPLSKAQHKEWLDSFISARTAKDSENNESKQFWFWDQSNYFISHSAMREFEFKIFDKKGVFADIYKESYKTQIMDRWIKKDSKFGRY
ncbi:hypothetical protein [Actinobacillus equuli]|uniref:hypothetical protein n=1 Tax=Actinobacillus equuli TaxID=718 RepID=UPI0024432911|nr:hypothetical protein [Actinobacillus equuli]WGE59636.1 hypothetical protein NYR73_02495 [Actinobacillus equuli subsp. haemolyticus]